jgi:putative ABC transport system permease protein
MKKLFPRLLIARRNLSRARARTVLAVLAIVIGVVAIASLGLFGIAFKRAQMESLEEFGSTVEVRPGEDLGERHLSPATVDEIRSVVDNGEVVPLKSEFRRFEAGRRVSTARLYGVEDPDRLMTTTRGTIPRPWRERALVGTGLARELGVGPGDRLDVGNDTYYVAGIIQARSDVRGGFFPRRSVVLPADTFEQSGYREAMILTESNTQATKTERRLRAEFNDREQRLSVTSRSFSGDVDEFYRQINLFLIGIGAISLIVGGVSITNVMLMSVMERREEIGVFRAVGFGRLDIVRVVLAESALLGFTGAVVGVLLSLGVGAGIQQVLLGDPYAFTLAGLRYVAFGFAFGVGISVFGGLYPAWKAARERPVDALRS